MHLNTEDGLLLLRGALLLCLVSATIGSAGMIVSGMVPLTELPRVYVQWALGDLLGTTTMTPCVLLLFDRQRHARTPHARAKTRWHGYAAWWLAMLLALTATMLFSRQSGLYPRAGVILPIVLLLWSAIRYPPLFTAVATMLTSTVLALIMGMGLDHIPRPETLLDTSLLMSTLVVISTIPSLLAAATHERRAAMAALHLRATRDPLTGLFNRTTFEEQARTLLLDHSGPLTLIYVDLDNFKLVNDAASHAAGDEVLRHVAGLVRAEFGEQALHAHSGGDEFMILMPLDSSAASVPGRRLLASIESLRVAWQGSNLRTTASIGLISSVQPHASFDELLSQVDTACHAAKELGGNRLFAAGQDADSLDNRNRMMRNALDAREASVVRDLTRTRRFIDRMRSLGCRFALDDFGTGFCSFSYLRDLNVDFLKIDGSFVRDLSQSPLSEAVVRSITEIAHLLEMRAVGEQVETDAQLTLLRGLQVDFGQGYLFQRPAPIDEFFTVPTLKRASA
nr:EAL domain-containing protein [Thermomonas paludicola]